jgi:colanic acid/amylovoran biosynthesis glycosyltransferase
MARSWRKAVRVIRRQSWEVEITAGNRALLRRHRPDVVLAEFGTTGVIVSEACRLEKVPLVVHFHGRDASHRDVLSENEHSYSKMFAQAAAVIAVSKAMRDRLIDLGAPPERLFHIPYGIDLADFQGSDPSVAPPTFLAVGRFVEKKAPHLTILSFAETLRSCPDARLRMIGEGELLGACRDLACALGVGNAVTFLGAQSHTVVAEEMRRARAFVQHSVVAESGDSEGTPVAVLEASASGLPVVATRHAGIPDVIIDGQTGFLVEERDCSAMGRMMGRLADDQILASELGAAGRRRVAEHYNSDRSICSLRRVLEGACRRGKTR